MKVLVLDAMGVIYPVGDDVRGLLYPFILEKRGVFDFAVIENYLNWQVSERSLHKNFGKTWDFTRSWKMNTCKGLN